MKSKKKILSKQAEHISKRGKAPSILVPRDKVISTRLVWIPANELDTLKIDVKRYQRTEKNAKVREIIGAILAGGYISPIEVTEYKDGTREVTDGGQRLMAHKHTSSRIQALVIRITDRSIDPNMFLAGNNSQGIWPGTKVKAWPHPGGELIRWFNNNKRSAFFGEVEFDKSGRVMATTLAKSLLAALSGNHGGSRVYNVMEKLDGYVDRMPARSIKTAEMLAVVLERSFDGDNHIAPSVAAVGYGLVCHEYWKDLAVANAWPTPSNRQYASLRRIGWDAVCPKRHERMALLAADEIKKKWSSRRAHAA